jgi:photosystem II stability/assembly factor-like uncharacterized protein
MRRGLLGLMISFSTGCLFFEASTLYSEADCVPQWMQIGPAPLIPGLGASNAVGPESGMVRDIAIDPRGSTDQTIYVATDSGGIWKTTNGGSTWSPKTDFMPSLNMGAVALDPGNPSIVYAGSGNGLYKSTNDGDNWGTALGGNIFANIAINRIVFTAPNVLLVATGLGIYRSIDGGAHFGTNSPRFDDTNPIRSGNATDLDVDTASATTVYASIAGSGVFKSVFKSSDNSVTFPDSGKLFTATNGAPTQFGFIAFAQSTQPNNQTMYVNVQFGSFQVGMFKSTNGGTSWSQITLTGEPGLAIAGYAQTVGVDPQDANRVFLGTRALYMATDGVAGGLIEVTPGSQPSNRIDFDKVHADQHALVFSPPGHRTPSPAPTRFYNGTDGGIATNPDGGVNNWTLLNGSGSGAGALATILLRQIDIGRGSTANNVYTYGAAQDNGLSSSHRSDSPGLGWHEGRGGDGDTVAVDPLDPDHALGDEDGNFRQATSGGDFDTSGGSGLPPPFPPAPAPSSPVNQLYFDPNGRIAYALLGGINRNKLYRSLDSGSNFFLVHTFTPNTSSVSAINIAQISSNTIWVGLDDGTVWHTSSANDGGAATWTNSPIPNAPPQQVRGVAIDPANTSQVVVVYSGGSVFRTTNSGAGWTDITGNLSSVSARANAVVIDPNTSPHTIIVATDVAVMQTTNQGATWEAVGQGLPHVNCTSLAIDPTAVPSLLRVGTYGRSAFELTYDRKYVNRQNFGSQDGTRENPFRTVSQALNAPTSGAARSISIQNGGYHESPLTIRQCTTLNALNGAAAIQ